MTSSFTHTIKNAWQRNMLGSGMLITGNVLCMAGIILSIFLKLSLGTFSENTPYIVAMIGIGITFILTGINIILLPPRLPTWHTGIYKKYIEENEILIIECIVPIILVVLLFGSYPDGWHYPQLYIMSVPYAICMSLLTINILFNANEKETEITYIRKELELRSATIKEKEELSRDNAAPDYVIEFTDKLKINIDELKSVMDDLKTSIDNGTKGISERTASTVNKYRYDNEQLHNDVQKFKQRMEKEKEEFKEYANERIIKSLMKALESIDEILRYNKNTRIVKEIEEIRQDILNTLKEEGIDIINPPIGDDFDDKKCCAVQTVETDKFPEKKIVDIKKIGYMFKSGKVIKYADVIVSKSRAKINEDNSAKTETAKADNNAKTEDDKSKVKDEDIRTKTQIKGEENKSKMKTEDTKIKLDGDKIEDTKVKTDKIGNKNP